MKFKPAVSTRSHFYLDLCLILLATLLLSSSCSTHKKVNTTAPLKNDYSRTSNAYSESGEKERMILAEFMNWRGTKHSMGGDDRTGIDCSGFVRAVYKNVFNIDLPRTTKMQIKKGSPVNKNELSAGDLVFFKPPTYPCHVGIFLSENDFVHASKKKGVIISQIDSHYWGKYYWTARRILEKQ